MTRAEYVSDAVVHVAGLVLVAGAVPWLILMAADNGHPPATLGVSNYGASLALMILASALYNMILSERWGRILCRLDHSAIYLKIAGTFSGFALIAGQGLGILSVIWGIAAAGIWLKIAAPGRYRMLGIALYLGMGWAGVLVGWDIFAGLPSGALPLIIAGGLLYTAGVAFFLWEALPHNLAVWHVFVLVASGLLFAAMVTSVT